MFGIKYPIISAPMGPFYTTELCVAVSEAGGLGVLSHTNLKGVASMDQMKKSFEYVVEHTNKPFGFNIRVARMQPDAMPLVRSVVKWIEKDPKLRDQCVYGLTSSGSPTKAAGIWKEKCLNLKHFHVAPSLTLAEKIVKAGCDGLVMTGAEGGGYQSYEQIATLPLVQGAVREYPNIPIIACGGIGSPEGVAMAIAGGADAVAMGTRFIASKQSEYSEKFKSLIYPAKMEDTVLTTGSFGPIRLLKNKYSLSHGPVLTKQEKLTQENGFSMEELDAEMDLYELAFKGDMDNGAILLGQSIGLIENELDVKDIVQGFSDKAEDLLINAVAKILK